MDDVYKTDQSKVFRADTICRIDILKQRLGISTLDQLKCNPYWNDFLCLIVNEMVSPELTSHIAGIFRIPPNDFTEKCHTEYQKSKQLQCEILLETYRFKEADDYYKKNIGYIAESWYENIKSRYYDLMINTLKTKLKTIVDKFCESQSFGIKRSLWNQEYSQREFDENQITLVSKQILEMTESLEQFPENWDLLTIKQKDELDLSRQYISELDEILLSETKKEKDSLDALNAPWKTVLALEDITKLTKPILTENDLKLVSDWSLPDKPDSYRGKAMTSAREAEVAAFQLYSNLYGSAEDISILQIISPKDNRWKYADIATNRRWIDIKNARTSFSSPETYSEHCVPQFKLDRNKRDVSTSSFLSQYRDNISQPITWLGETTLGEIEKLQNEFNSQYLEVTFAAHLNNSFLPAWLFDYPSVCYTDREKAIALIRSPEFVFPRQECNIGCGVLANVEISSNTDKALASEAMELQRRIQKCGLSRAVLFLHILDRFAANKAIFNNTDIKKILFPNSNNHDQVPLGVYDPLQTVWNLCDMLAKVSQNCLQKARCFTTFRLRGANIFQGRNHDGDWSTIFAYCGGWRRSNDGARVRCGQNPIYLGQDRSCRTCGRLICHKCGFCSTQCPDCKMRQEKWEQTK